MSRPTCTKSWTALWKSSSVPWNREKGLRRFLDVVDGREGTLGERDRKRLEKLDQLDSERIFQSIRQNNRLSELRMEEQAQEAGHPYCNRNVVEGPGSP